MKEKNKMKEKTNISIGLILSGIILVLSLSGCVQEITEVTGPTNTTGTAETIEPTETSGVGETGSIVGEARRVPTAIPQDVQPTYIEAIDFEMVSPIPDLTKYYNKELSYLGNLAPFPTKSLLPYWNLKMHGVVDSETVELGKFYLLEGPMTEKTTVVQTNADLIQDGATTEETVLNILKWIHTGSQMKSPSQCSLEQKDLLEAEYKESDGKWAYPDSVKRTRTATEIILSKCFTGCTEYVLVFAALARAKNIPATVTETISEKWVAEMVWSGQWNGNKEGHFFSEVYLSEKNAWVVVDPTANKLTGRDDNGYYPSGPGGNKRYMLFERGLDHYDYGMETTEEFGETVKKRYYINGSQP